MKAAAINSYDGLKVTKHAVGGGGVLGGGEKMIKWMKEGAVNNGRS